jgi:hypothetical protein
MRTNITYIAGIALVLASCSSIPPVSEREPSPYTLHFENREHNALYATINNAKSSDIASVELWYVNELVDHGAMLEDRDNASRVVFHGWFTWRASPFAEVKVLTHSGVVHDFMVGDPLERTTNIYSGTQYRF